MSDDEVLVELRAVVHGSCREAYAKPGLFEPCPWCGPRLRAAGEIERLRAVIGALLAVVSRHDIDAAEAMAGLLERR